MFGGLEAVVLAGARISPMGEADDSSQSRKSLEDRLHQVRMSSC